MTLPDPSDLIDLTDPIDPPDPALTPLDLARPVLLD